MTVGEGWRIMPLSDVVLLQRGFDLPARERRPGRFPVLTSGETGGTHDQGPVRGPGVVVGRASNLGRPKWSEGDFWPHNTTMFVKDFMGNEPRWVYHLFENTDLAGFNSGSVQPMLNRNYIAGVPVMVPPATEQREIAKVLRALDDKIAMNAEVVQTIESLTLAIYTRGLAGYEMAPLSATADFVNGKAFTKGASGTGRVVVRIAELNSGLGGSTVFSDAEVEEKHVARPGDILFAWSGSLTLSRWYRDDAIVNQHIFKVIPKAGYPSWLVYQLIRAKLAEFKSIAADKATTMGHIQRHHLDESVAIPAPEEMVRMDAVMSPLWQRGLVAEQESLTLAKLRDALLPELMSGRLRVKDAENKIEEVV